jgi:hypothetical protein
LKRGASASVVGKGGKINPRYDDCRSKPLTEAAANTSSKKNVKKTVGEMMPVHHHNINTKKVIFVERRLQ